MFDARNALQHLAHLTNWSTRSESETELVHTWLPFAEQLKSWCRSPCVTVGIQAQPGLGKTTLCEVLRTILELQGIPTEVVSLDEIYLPHAALEQLRSQSPHFRWRSPPGTHDVQLGTQILADLKAGRLPVRVPIYDKTAHAGHGDRAGWRTIARAPSLVLFEGWFTGVHPAARLQDWLEPHGPWSEEELTLAHASNAALAAYVPLWELLDRQVVFAPLDFGWSRQWRMAAERGMNTAAVSDFVAYQWVSLCPPVFFRPLQVQAGEPGFRQLDLRIDFDFARHPLPAPIP